MKNFFAWVLLLSLIGIISVLGYSLYNKIIKTDPQINSVQKHESANSTKNSPETLTPLQSPPLVKKGSQIAAKESPLPHPLTTDGTIEFSGLVYFAADFRNVVKTDQGNPVLKELKRDSLSINNLLGASGANITVKDSTNKIIGIFTTDDTGRFAFNVPKDDFYQLELLFRNTTRTADLKVSDTKDLFFYYGYYSNGKGYFSSPASYSHEDPLK